MKKMFLILTLMLSFMVSSVVNAKVLGEEYSEVIMTLGEPIMPITTSWKPMKAGGLWKYEGRIHYCGLILVEGTSEKDISEQYKTTWLCIDSRT